MGLQPPRPVDRGGALAAAPQDPRALDPRCKRLTLVATVVGSAIVFLDGTVVNVALPALREDFNAGLAAQQWVVEGYLLTLGALLLLGGSLGDLLGRRRIFIVGLAAFALASLACALAPTVELEIAMRAIQGVAGALLVPSSLAIITATFPREERGRAIGSWTAWTGIAIMIGPLVGGFLIDAVSWRLIFALNVPLCLVGIYLATRFVPESRDPDCKPIDYTGAALISIGLAGLVFGLIEQPRYGFADPLVAVPLAVGVVCLVGFVAYEHRSAAPMLPLSMFRSRNFSVGNGATVMVYGALYSSTFLLSLLLQQVAGYSAFETGLALSPPTLLMFFLASRFGALADRIGPRLLMGAGPLVVAAGLALGLRIEGDADYLTTVLPVLLLFGLGLAMTVAPLTAAVLGAVDEGHAGIASGANNAVSRVAGLIAIAVVGAAVSAQFGATLDDRLTGERLDQRGQAIVERAKESPLEGGASAASAGPAQRQRLEASIDDASVAGFHLGIGACALLAFAGGLIAAAGIRNPPRDCADVRSPVPGTAARTKEPVGAT